MSDNTSKSVNVSYKPKKDDCCGGTPAKDQKAQLAKKDETRASTKHKHENMPKSDGGSGCCGGSKATK